MNSGPVPYKYNGVGNLTQLTVWHTKPAKFSYFFFRSNSINVILKSVKIIWHIFYRSCSECRAIFIYRIRGGLQVSLLINRITILFFCGSRESFNPKPFKLSAYMRYKTGYLMLKSIFVSIPVSRNLF